MQKAVFSSRFVSICIHETSMNGMKYIPFKHEWYVFLWLAGGFVGQDSDKSGVSMFDIQCLLDKEGASELVIDVIVNTKNDRIFSEGILLGIALLEGGNTQTQVLVSFTYSHVAL